MPFRHSLTGLAMLVVALGPASRVANADNGPYSIHDAGPPAGIAYGLNKDALVVGAAGDAWTSLAFQTAFGQGPQWLTGLDTAGGDAALGVHDDGWSVGSSLFEFSRKPVVFTAGLATQLLPETMYGEATAVNRHGVVTGYMYDAGFVLRAAVWAPGGSAQLLSDQTAWAFAINDGGVVTGQVMPAPGTGVAFRWQPGVGFESLPTLGGTSALGRGINNLGDVVGESYRENGFSRIAAWWRSSDDEVVDLGTLGGSQSSAADVNNHGQIVGWSLDASGERRAFLYADGAMVDLNTLIEPDSGWVLLSANAINDAGQITGEGQVEGGVRAFLLTPPVNSDTTPPVISAAVASPGSVWPPRHQMVDVEVSVSATDDSGDVPECRLTGVSASEPDNSVGDGDTVGDAVVTGTLTAQVRAERSGPLGNRLYSLDVECVDGSGNAAQSAATVVIGDATAAKTLKKK
jgi:probable HAF family extracellular repeat protein